MSFYIIILLARINARIQALLRQGFGIPLENETLKSENEKLNIAKDRIEIAKYTFFQINICIYQRFSLPLQQIIEQPLYECN